LISWRGYVKITMATVILIYDRDVKHRQKDAIGDDKHRLKNEIVEVFVGPIVKEYG